jgi:hypothetical protein
MRLDLLPYQIAGGAEGAFRRIGVVPDGNDWQTVRSDGSTLVEVKLVFETTDGSLIGMTYKGIRPVAADVIERVNKGEDVNPAHHCFRTNPVFETASNYAWTNGIISIGYRAPDGVIDSLFEIL